MFAATNPIDLNREQIEAFFDVGLASERIRSAFIADFQGRIQTTAVGQLHFPMMKGDVQIKSGHIEGSETCVVKVASILFGKPGAVHHGCLV